MMIKLSLIAMFLLAQQVSSYRLSDYLKRGACMDMSDDCEEMIKYVGCRDENVKTYCKESCQLCGGGTPAPSNECADINPACPQYVQMGLCAPGTESSSAIRHMCKKSCDLCDGDKQDANDCKDYGENCGLFDQAGFCDPASEQFEMVKRQCKKTCKLCSDAE